MAIIEGLQKNIGMENPRVDLQSVYWADVTYDTPDPNPDAYREAAEGALKTYEESWGDAVREGLFG